MKVGDLVMCRTVGGGKMGIVVEHFKVSDLWGVILSHTGAMACFQSQHLAVLNARR
jgi:hypothetical protein